MTAPAIRSLFRNSKGILRFAPNWIPRNFNRPGRRLRLHPDDYYRLGPARGAIKERWFCSTTPAINGPLAPPDEGLSKVAVSDRYEDCLYFRDVLKELGPELVGEELYGEYGGWPMFAKFFDYDGPLFHHLHLNDADAARIDKLGKPEAYYFPPQMNNHMGSFPVTYFGYDPDVTPEQVRERLEQFEAGDNRITELSRAYRIQLGTGWYTPPGVVHAPGSCLTYEPQWNSDVSAVQENVVEGEIFGRENLVVSVPEDRKNDMDALMALMDWQVNTDPHYRKKYFLEPRPVREDTPGYSERWITYRNPFFAAKETVVPPASCVRLTDRAAYGCIIVQGYGSFGPYDDAEAASMLRFDQLSGDEYFVSERSAQGGVTVRNASRYEPMVILRHFGPNSGAPRD